MRAQVPVCMSTHAFYQTLDYCSLPPRQPPPQAKGTQPWKVTWLFPSLDSCQ